MCGASRNRSRRSPRASSPRSPAQEPRAAEGAAAAVAAAGRLEDRAAVGRRAVAARTLVEEAYDVRALNDALTELHQVSILTSVTNTAGAKQRGETEVRSKDVEASSRRLVGLRSGQKGADRVRRAGRGAKIGIELTRRPRRRAE